MIRRTVLALALLLLLPAGAHAESSVLLRLDPTVTASAALPAAAGPGGVVLPVTGGTTKQLQLAGTVTLAGLTLTHVRAELTRPSRLSAIVGGTRRTVLTLKGTTTVSGRRIRLRSLAALPAGMLKRRLGSESIGRLSADVTLPAPLPAFPRPAGAVDVTSSSLTWSVRDSLVRYLAAGEGIDGLDGATAGAKAVHEGTDVPLAYDFAFTPAAGWSDTATQRTLLAFRGTLRLRYRAHGIDLRLSDPELRITGSRAVVVLRASGTGAATRRASLVALDLSQPTAPATITATGADLLAGFYPAGDPFGAMRVAFTTP